jgi:hypothetical protein
MGSGELQLAHRAPRRISRHCCGAQADGAFTEVDTQCARPIHKPPLPNPG